MTEYAVGDVVRILQNAAPHMDECGVVVRLSAGVKHSLSVEFDLGESCEVLAYAPREVQLVRAVVSAPRSLTVSL